MISQGSIDVADACRGETVLRFDRRAINDTAARNESRRRLAWLFHLCLASLLAACASVTCGDEPANTLASVLEHNCVPCHSHGEANGDVNFESITPAAEWQSHSGLIVRTLEAVDSGAMPPDDAPALEEATRRLAVTALKSLLKSSSAHVPPPATPLQRLNRFQYNYTVRDLFQLDRDVFALPEKLMTRHDNYLLPVFDSPQQVRMPNTVCVASHSLAPRPGLRGVKPFPKDLRAAHGFDNQANQLTLSPLLLDAFLRLSVSIVDSPDFHEETVGIWQTFFAAPEGGIGLETEVRSRLTWFLKMAFRRSIDRETLDRYVEYSLEQIHQQSSFPEGMKKAAAAILSSPKFLYRATLVEDTHRQFELASRLAYFLWSSCPDEALLELAARGELSDPQVLERTIGRMMFDPKIERFLDTFPTQWMQLENALAATPDPNLSPYFNLDAEYPASLQMVLEPLLLFDTVFVEDRPLADLIAPSFGYRSEFLQSWYGSGLQPPAVDVAAPAPENPTRDQQHEPLENEQPRLREPTENARKTYEEDLRSKLRAQEFHRITLEDARYGGIVTNAAVLTMTSGPKRTHPVARGVWVVEVLFNTPPAPPPNDVPPLNEDPADKHLTIREQFAAHRDNPSCAGCHTKLDPLGFALENYDLTGRWRDSYGNGRQVDASGEWLRRHSFDNPVSFKEAILKEERRFATAFAKHLLRFAIGRELQASDLIAIDDIVEQTSAEGFRLQSVMRAVINSDPFLQIR